MPREHRAKRPTLRQRLLAPLRFLVGLFRSKPRGQGRKPSPRALLLPGRGKKRTLQQWKELRRSTTAEVRAHLAAQDLMPAIKTLTRALLNDPQHPRYHELLQKAVELRRQRDIPQGHKDPWSDLPTDLRQAALQLEMFSAYVEALEQLFDQVGIPPLSAPLPPGLRPSGDGAGEKDPGRKRRAAAGRKPGKGRG